MLKYINIIIMLFLIKLNIKIIMLIKYKIVYIKKSTVKFKEKLHYNESFSPSYNIIMFLLQLIGFLLYTQSNLFTYTEMISFNTSYIYLLILVMMDSIFNLYLGSSKDTICNNGILYMGDFYEWKYIKNISIHFDGNNNDAAEDNSNLSRIKMNYECKKLFLQKKKTLNLVFKQSEKNDLLIDFIKGKININV